VTVVTQVHIIDDERRWRLLAAEAQAIADAMSDAACKRIMRNLAFGYLRLAEHARQRDAIDGATAALLK
jgi:hypothetical protein